MSVDLHTHTQWTVTENMDSNEIVAVVLLGHPFHPVSCWHAYNIITTVVTHSTLFRVGSRWLSYVQLRSLVGAITGLCTSLITHSTLFHVGSRWFSYVQLRSLIGAITRLYTPVVTTFQPACPTTTTTTTTTTTISQQQNTTPATNTAHTAR